MLVCGFQGVDGAADITTLGREGATPARVAVAAALGRGQMPDLHRRGGRLHGGPAQDPEREELDAIPYDEYAGLRLPSGTGCCTTLRRYWRNAVTCSSRSASSFTRTPGTRVAAAVRRADAPAGLRRRPLFFPTGTPRLVSVVGAGLPDDPAIAGRVFEALAARQDRHFEGLLRRAAPLRARRGRQRRTPPWPPSTAAFFGAP